MLDTGEIVEAKDLRDRCLLRPQWIDKDRDRDNSPIVKDIDFNDEPSEVYNFTMLEGEPWGIVEDVVARNCGEQSLPEYGVCDLGSLNLPQFLSEDPIGECVVNWESIAVPVRRQRDLPGGGCVIWRLRSGAGRCRLSSGR